MAKPKYHSGQKRTTVSLSFSAPVELEAPMNQAAAARGMNRSQYLCWLVAQDLRFGQGLLSVPPRIRRRKH
jgi:hypothetical protein